MPSSAASSGACPPRTATSSDLAPWTEAATRRSAGGRVLLLVSLLLAGPCVKAADVPAAPSFPRAIADEFDTALAATQDEFGFAGAIAGIWSPAGSWVGTVGHAAAATGERITPEHHTRIGSVTKTFIGTLLLQEVEKGTLSLNDPIERYVPGLPNGSVATLRDLAQMTSGIPSYTYVFEWMLDFFTDVERVFTAQELLAYVKGMPALFPPGTRFDYSNTNTVALGLALERATRRPLGTLLTTQVLQPLGLSRTYWPDGSPALPRPFLAGQSSQGLPEDAYKDTTRWNPSWAHAAGEMISTLRDLRIWGEALGTGRGILQPATHQRRMASLEENLAIEGNEPAGVYGIGVGLIDGWVGHTGEMPGYNTSVLHERATHTTVVVVVNSDIPDFRGQNPAPTISERLRTALAMQTANPPRRRLPRLEESAALRPPP